MKTLTFVIPECFYRESRTSRSPINTFGDDKKLKLFVIVFVTLLFVGCQTTHNKPMTSRGVLQYAPTQSAVSALGAVTEGLTNQNISQKDLKNLATRVQKDPQTKSAVSSINQALSVNQTCVKYCPVDGQRFDCKVDICPVHKVKLKLVE